MTKKKSVSKEDIDNWQKYIKNPTDVVDKDNYNIANEKNVKKNRFKYDLHGYSLLDANKKVKEIILSSAGAGCEEILLITGKGLHSTTDADVYVSKDLSKLKSSVPEFIRNDDEINKYVISISEASIEDGGAGAILIKLKNL